jgi:DNA-binding LacI/PurR family transcriptional regulator
VVSFASAPDLFSGIADIARQGSSAYEVTRARLRGYASALEAAGIPWPGVPVYEQFESATEAGRAAAEVLLSREPRPTAILCLSDQLAFGFIEGARERGFRVPEDISVAGFDDVPEAARSTPPLTTVHQPHVEKGALAGRILLARIRVEEPPESDALRTRLVVRGSTARVDDNPLDGLSG